MRWTQTLLTTLREAPAEAEIASHQLLLRAGLARKLTSGLYSFLPLGLRALRKVEKIVREEMDRAGGLEILMPALQPPELWERSGRIEAAADVLFHVKDHQDRRWILGPTHEEVDFGAERSESGAGKMEEGGVGWSGRDICDECADRHQTGGFMARKEAGPLRGG